MRRLIVINRVWAGSAKHWDADGLSMSDLGETPLHDQGEPTYVRGEEMKAQRRAGEFPNATLHPSLQRKMASFSARHRCLAGGPELD